MARPQTYAHLPAPLLESYAWQYRGECRHPRHGPLWFSPEGERGPARHTRELKAKAVCMTCPVLAACREHALTTREPHGVWGGLSETDRTARRR